MGGVAETERAKDGGGGSVLGVFRDERLVFFLGVQARSRLASAVGMGGRDGVHMS